MDRTTANCSRLASSPTFDPTFAQRITSKKVARIPALLKDRDAALQSRDTGPIRPLDVEDSESVAVLQQEAIVLITQICRRRRHHIGTSHALHGQSLLAAVDMPSHILRRLLLWLR